VKKRQQETTYENIQLEGDEDFIDKTKKALMLLLKSGTFQEIKNYLGKIKQHHASGMRVYANPPTFEVNEPTWSSNITGWYASTIAHDTYHSYLYHNNQEWHGKKAEQNCLRIQLSVLEEIGSDESTKEYIKSLLDNPVYQDINYAKRNW
jgi:hypothetical protein